MNDILKGLIMGKLQSLTAKDLLIYARQHDFKLTQKEADQIISYLKTTPIDPFTQKGRKKLFNDLASITDQQTALKAEKLFRQIIQTYGVGYMFE